MHSFNPGTGEAEQVDLRVLGVCLVYIVSVRTARSTSKDPVSTHTHTHTKRLGRAVFPTGVP